MSKTRKIKGAWEWLIFWPRYLLIMSLVTLAMSFMSASGVFERMICTSLGIFIWSTKAKNARPLL